MRNIFTLILTLFVSVSVLPSQSLATERQEKKPKATKAIDLNFNYHYDVSDFESAQLFPLSKSKKKISKLGVVSEEKNTSTSQQKSLLDPYHRTVSTGLSF